MIFCRIRGKWLLTDELRRGIIEDKRWNFCSIYFVKMNQIFQKSRGASAERGECIEAIQAASGEVGDPPGKEHEIEEEKM